MKLIDVLLNTYDYSISTVLYLPNTSQYEADTECFVEPQEGFNNCLSMAEISDVCDGVLSKMHFLKIHTDKKIELLKAFNDVFSYLNKENNK